MPTSPTHAWSSTIKTAFLVDFALQLETDSLKNTNEIQRIALLTLHQTSDHTQNCNEKSGFW